LNKIINILMNVGVYSLALTHLPQTRDK